MPPPMMTTRAVSGHPGATVRALEFKMEFLSWKLPSNAQLACVGMLLLSSLAHTSYQPTA